MNKGGGGWCFAATRIFPDASHVLWDFVVGASHQHHVDDGVIPCSPGHELSSLAFFIACVDPGSSSEHRGRVDAQALQMQHPQQVESFKVGDTALLLLGSEWVMVDIVGCDPCGDYVVHYQDEEMTVGAEELRSADPHDRRLMLQKAKERAQRRASSPAFSHQEVSAKTSTKLAAEEVYFLLVLFAAILNAVSSRPQRGWLRR
jgi:hypothetical protein